MKPLLLIINGWGFKDNVFDHLVERLDDYYHISIINTTKAITQNHFEYYNHDDVFVITWSLGFNYYIKHLSDKLNTRALISISGTPSFINQESFTLGWDKRILERMSNKLTESKDQVMRDFLENALFDSTEKSNEVSYNDLLITDDGLAESLLKLTSIDSRGMLSNIDYHCLFIHGQNDNIISWDNSAWMSKTIKGSRLEIIDNCGHIPHMEAVHITAELINDFIQDIRSMK